jgi:hypothetical protein
MNEIDEMGRPGKGSSIGRRSLNPLWEEVAVESTDDSAVNFYVDNEGSEIIHVDQPGGLLRLFPAPWVTNEIH